jgi:hypothetical protein
MPRYKLRTLLVVMTLVGGPLARIGYLKRMADFHRQRDAQLVNQLTAEYFALRNTFIGSQPVDQELIDATIQGQIDGELIIDVNVLRTDKPWTVYFAREEGNRLSHVRYCSEDEALRWFTAAYHRRMAMRYEQAMFRPWQTPVVDPPPE